MPTETPSPRSWVPSPSECRVQSVAGNERTVIASSGQTVTHRPHPRHQSGASAALTRTGRVGAVLGVFSRRVRNDELAKHSADWEDDCATDGAHGAYGRALILGPDRGARRGPASRRVPRREGAVRSAGEDDIVDDSRRAQRSAEAGRPHWTAGRGATTVRREDRECRAGGDEEMVAIDGDAADGSGECGTRPGRAARGTSASGSPDGVHDAVVRQPVRRPVGECEMRPEVRRPQGDARGGTTTVGGNCERHTTRRDERGCVVGHDVDRGPGQLDRESGTARWSRDERVVVDLCVDSADVSTPRA